MQTARLQRLALLIGCVVLSAAPGQNGSLPQPSDLGRPNSTQQAQAPATEPPAAQPPAASEPAPPGPPADGERFRGRRGTSDAAAGDNLPRLREGRISMTFENADIRAVLRALSEIWGETITMHPDLQGSVTILSARDVTVPESFEIVRSALAVRGYAIRGSLTDESKILEILPRREAVAEGAPVRTGTDPAALPSDNRLVTQIVPLRYIRARQVADVLQPLINKERASLVALEDTNTLIITDTVENVRRLLAIVAQIDEVPEDRRQLAVVRLEYANAVEVQQMLQSIFADPLTGAAAAQARGGGGNPQMNAQQLQALASSVDPTTQIRITADARTNSLVLYGPPATIDRLKAVIADLDDNIARPVTVRTFHLQYAEAATVAQSLSLLFQQPEGGTSRTPSFLRRSSQTPATSGVRGFTTVKENIVLPDLRTNSLIVTASPENMAIYEQLISTLDRPAAAQNVVEVIPLEFANARTVATTMQQLLRGGRGSTGWFFFLFGDSRATDSPLQQLRDVTVVADTGSNTLIVTGPGQTLALVRQIVDKLDQPQAQVYINVIIADVTLGKDQQLGVEMAWMGDNHTLSSNFGSTGAIPQGVRYALVSGEFQGLLRALSDRNKVKVLSTPHITTLDNVEATISIGQQFPFPEAVSETTGGNVVSNFALKDIVIQLQVTPRVSLGSKTVVLDVNQTIDELTGTVRQGNLELPLIATRRANTQVMVNTGQTIVLGGIIRDRNAKQTVGVPILQDIPILGELFKRTRDQSERTELMVFLTPFVVTSSEQLDRIRMLRQEELRKQFPQVDEVLESNQGFTDPTLATAPAPATTGPATPAVPPPATVAPQPSAGPAPETRLPAADTTDEAPTAAPPGTVHYGPVPTDRPRSFGPATPTPARATLGPSEAAGR